jgi:hypothetical protein
LLMRAIVLGATACDWLKYSIITYRVVGVSWLV